ncbi:MAG: chromosomal replication initiator protein DnaA [Deltaproteobacteria bacterium]|jgi:chromosomal replication initiator protein|nr:chromosomal replication initiator protein DnaA [Deltaproteobacteria bacterium]
MQELAKIWPDAKKALADNLSPETSQTWIEPLGIKWVDQTRLEIVSPNEFFLKYVLNHYKNDIERAVLAICQERGFTDVSLSFTHARGLLARGRLMDSPDGHRSPFPWTENSDEVWNEIQRHKLLQGAFRFNPHFTFENFVVGGANSFAYSAAQAFSRDDKLGTNILFLTSGHGLGKSHLSQALGKALVENQPARGIIYLTAEDFTNEMTKALQEKSMEDFKRRFRAGCDFLMLEEVTFFSGKIKIQDELVFTLDYLLNQGKKIVLTSTVEPKSIPHLGQSLKSRFYSSLVTPIGEPDFDTRIKILSRKCKLEGLSLSRKVLETIAASVTSDVRLLEAAVTTIAARARLQGKPPDLSLARECLGAIANSDEEGVTLNGVLKYVCRAFKIEPAEIQSSSRVKKLNEARKIGIYLCRVLTSRNLEDIGQTFGRRHSSALYNINQLEREMKADSRVKQRVEYYIGEVSNQ